MQWFTKTANNSKMMYNFNNKTNMLLKPFLDKVYDVPKLCNNLDFFHNTSGNSRNCTNTSGFST